MASISPEVLGILESMEKKGLAGGKAVIEEINRLISENAGLHSKVYSLMNDIDFLHKSINGLKMEKDNLQAMNLELQNKNNRVNSDLALVNSRLNNKFTNEQLSIAMNKVVNSINNVENDDAAANYIVSELDMDLKATVLCDEKGEMVFLSPDVSSRSADSLSTIRFSIRAIPKLK